MGQGGSAMLRPAPHRRAAPSPLHASHRRVELCDSARRPPTCMQCLHGRMGMCKDRLRSKTEECKKSVF